VKYHKFIFLAIILLLLAPFSYSQHKSFVAKNNYKVAEMIAALPEVIKSDEYCKKASKGKRYLLSYVAGDPGSEDGNYYRVNVSEDNGVAYHTWYTFLVNARTYRIIYIDIMNDKYISLATWRKQKGYLGF
jgi:hypothetical protein